MPALPPTSRVEAATRLAEDEKKRRVQRLREVRAQESKIAAETRATFKRAATQRAGALLDTAQELWRVRQAAAMQRAGQQVAGRAHPMQTAGPGGEGGRVKG